MEITRILRGFDLKKQHGAVWVANSFHEKADLSQAGFVVSVEWSCWEPLRLCRHPSIRTLWWSDFRSVQVGRPGFSRCCYLIIDLDSHFCNGSWARTWAQSPELGGGARLFESHSTPRRLPFHSANLRHSRSPFHCALSASIVGSVSHPAGDRPSHPI